MWNGLVLEEVGQSQLSLKVGIRCPQEHQKSQEQIKASSVLI